MPHRLMNPTAAGTERYSRAASRPKMPPMAASGSTVMIRVAILAESKSMNSRKKIAAIVIGTITESRLIARSMFSN